MPSRAPAGRAATATWPTGRGARGAHRGLRGGREAHHARGGHGGHAREGGEAMRLPQGRGHGCPREPGEARLRRGPPEPPVAHRHHRVRHPRRPRPISARCPTASTGPCPHGRSRRLRTRGPPIPCPRRHARAWLRTGTPSSTATAAAAADGPGGLRSARGAASSGACRPRDAPRTAPPWGDSSEGPRTSSSMAGIGAAWASASSSRCSMPVSGTITRRDRRGSWAGWARCSTEGAWIWQPRHGKMSARPNRHGRHPLPDPDHSLQSDYTCRMRLVRAHHTDMADSESADDRVPPS